MGPSPHLWICALQNRVPCLPLELLVSMGPSPLLWFYAFKTATLAPQLQGSVSQPSSVVLMQAKQRD